MIPPIPLVKITGEVIPDGNHLTCRVSCPFLIHFIYYFVPFIHSCIFFAWLPKFIGFLPRPYWDSMCLVLWGYLNLFPS